MLMEGRILGESLSSYLMYFGFIRYEPGVEVFPLGWTIFVEETFYVFLPVLFGFVTDLRRAVLLAVVTLALSIIWTKAARHFNVPNVNLFVDLYPLRHWYAIALGIVLYFIYVNGAVKHRLLQSKILSWGLDALWILAVALAVRGENRVQASCGLAVLIVAALSTHSLAGRVCRSTVLRWFGVCCYSIYLLHFALLDVCDGFKDDVLRSLGLADSPLEVRFVVWFQIMAAFSLAVCMLVFHWFEKPCVDVGKCLIRRLEADRPAAVPTL